MCSERKEKGKELHMRMSIIVPIYNVEQYIEECLESIYNQNLTDFEVICIDDRGKDKSIQKVQEYVEKNNIKNLQIIEHSENKGLSEARNTGINNAKGKYICFLDSDDKLEKDGIGQLLKNAEEKDLDIVEGKVIELFETKCNIELGSNLLNRKDSKIVSGDEYFSNTIKNNEYLTSAWCRIFKKELLKNKVYFMPEIKFEDEEFSPRAIIPAKKVQYLNIPFYIYRRRDNSITTNMFKDNKWYTSYLKIIDSLEKYAKQIKNKKSYECLTNRIGQLALSILKNPIAYNASQNQVDEIIKEIRKEKIYRIPMKSKSFFIKCQGFFMMFPKLFISLYGKREKNGENKKCNN